jgi:hypothetical protein
MVQWQSMIRDLTDRYLFCLEWEDFCADAEQVSHYHNLSLMLGLFPGMAQRKVWDALSQACKDIKLY